MPPMPEGVAEGILKGTLPLPAPELTKARKAQIFGSGPILREALRAQELLGEHSGVSADVWSATSYKLLRGRSAACGAVEHAAPAPSPGGTSYVETVLAKVAGPVRCRVGLHEASCRIRLRPGYRAAM